MTRRGKIIALLTSTAAAVGVYLATGVMPAPPVDGQVWRGKAKMKCQRAIALSVDPGKLDCVPGERVYVRVEVIADVAAEALTWSRTEPTCTTGTKVEKLQVGIEPTKHTIWIDDGTGTGDVMPREFTFDTPVYEYRCVVDAPTGIKMLRKTWRKRATARHPDRALTVLGNTGAGRCLGGKVRRDRGDGTYWTPRPWGMCCGEGCECAGARCAPICPSHVYAGDTCDARICRRWPNLKGCSE